MTPNLATVPLTAVIQEAYIHGVSTRSVDDLVQAMGGSSKGSVGVADGKLLEGRPVSARAKSRGFAPRSMSG